MKKCLVICLTLCLCLTMLACGSEENAVYVQKVADLVNMGGIAPGDRFPGIVVSENITEIQKDPQMVVEELFVREGDDVSEGDQLFSYDTQQLQLSLDKQRLELEQNLDHTRLEMLKSQVNPHFLFNTLNLISCMARLEDAADTDKMILSLSGIFRYNLRTKEQEVFLAQELEALEDYIHIQQTRFDGRIAYKRQVEVDPMQVRIPSFTLQPIVENAFIHGLARREEGGRIFLRVWQRGNMLHISVADNGAGMDEEQLAALQRRMLESEQTGRGIGLGNISCPRRGRCASTAVRAGER